MKNYNTLLNALDSMFADYGNGSIEFPDHINDCEGDYDLLTEDQAKEVFEHNDGDVESILQYLADAENN